MTGVVALAGGAARGRADREHGPHRGGHRHGHVQDLLSASQIASRVDPALVDVVSTDGYQGATSAGTGIVLSSTGEVLTNNHVVNGATSIKVTDIGNGKTYTATVVGYDASHDVAVIQLQGASGLTTASLGDSSTVQTGDSVTALGNAEGKGGTPSVATGTVTALNQSITASDELSSVSEQLTGLIETNAPIQPGDSGGSLVNSYGQVIGMDTAAGSSDQPQGQSSTATATQAYAIPINEAVSIAQQIESGTTTADVHIGATAFLGWRSAPRAPAAGSSGGSNGFGGFGGSNGFGGSEGSNGFGGFGGFGGQSGQGSQGSQGSTSGVTVAGTVSGSPAANAGLTAGRHDHRDRRPVGHLGRGRRAQPGQVPPRQLGLGHLGGRVRPVPDREPDPDERPDRLGPRTSPAPVIPVSLRRGSLVFAWPGARTTLRSG